MIHEGKESTIEAQLEHSVAFNFYIQNVSPQVHLETIFAKQSSEVARLCLPKKNENKIFTQEYTRVFL